MAILTNRTFLMHKTSSATSYSKLVDITGFPDLGGTPEQIDITTLSNMSRRYMNGIQEQEAMAFTTLYDKTDYQTLKALEGEDEEYAVWFGGTDDDTPTGSNGKFSFTGQLSVYVNGGGVNEATNMTITIAPSSEIEFA